MKKIISVFLILIFTLGTFISCGDVKYDEQEVKTEAKRLIEQSIVLNDIYWGAGIPYLEDKNTSDGIYYKAQESYHYLLGFNTVDEMLSLTKKTFSEGYCSNIKATIFNSIQDGDNSLIPARYYQKYSYDKNGKVIGNDCIMVNSEWDRIFYGEVEYDYDSIVVIGSEDETVYVKINATVKFEDYEPQTREIRISLVEEKDGWKIDSPTYLNYDKTKIN